HLRLHLQVFAKDHPAEDHPAIIAAKNQLAFILLFQAKVRELEPLARQNLEAAKRVWRNLNVKTWEYALIHAFALYFQGRFSEAEQLSREVLSTGPDEMNAGAVRLLLGLVFRATGRWEDAEIMLWRSLEVYSKVKTPEDPAVLLNRCCLGTVLQALG